MSAGQLLISNMQSRRIINFSKRILVLMGGNSSERNESLRMGNDCVKALQELGYSTVQAIDVKDFSCLPSDISQFKPEVVFNALQGGFGENGALCGLLDCLNIPYTHSGQLATAAQMHKIVAKTIVSANGVLVAPSIKFGRFDGIETICNHHIVNDGPYVMKSVANGSSYGVHLFQKGVLPTEQLLHFADRHYGGQLMLEQFIPGREFTCAVLGDQVLGACEISQAKLDIFDANTKHKRDNSSNALRFNDLPAEIISEVKKCALIAHKALGCRTISRSDFRVTDDGEVFFLELNALPGLARNVSLVVQIAAQNGIAYNELIQFILEDAMEIDSILPAEYVSVLVNNGEMVRDLIKYAGGFAHSTGNMMPVIGMKNLRSEMPPTALFPSAFPAEQFQLAIELQQLFNELYFRVSLDHGFLLNAFQDVIKGDPFIKRHVDIMQKVYEEGIHQTLTLALQRSDYMCQRDELSNELEIKQVETNIGQIGGPDHGEQTSNLHTKMIQKLGNIYGLNISDFLKCCQRENKPKQRMAKCVYQAWKMFGDPKAFVVLIVLEHFRFDHFELVQIFQYELEEMAEHDHLHINCVCMNVHEAVKRIHLDEEHFTLFVDQSKKIALVHLDFGFLPEHYVNEEVWKLRLNMERSTAIISPNIRLQLSASKKIQQLLTQPGVVERFLPEQPPEKIALLRKTFTNMWALSDDCTYREIVEDSKNDPEKYVLKAHLDGGKGNFFGTQVTELLGELSLEDRGAYVVQEKIKPVVCKNYLVRSLFDEPELQEVTNELGIFGSVLGTSEDGGKLLHNSTDGFLVRSKPSNVSQVNVIGGSGVHDSPLLFSDKEFK